MTTLLTNLFYFFLAIAVLVTFHEFGHFIVARLLGIKVLTFSVGFGRVLASWRDRHGTRYCLSAVPFGGYVKMLDEFDGPVADTEKHRAFNRQPVWKRSLVVVAGPVFNILFAFLAYWLVFMIGVNRIMPVVGYVKAGSPAAMAGIQENQRVDAVNGQATIGWQEVNSELKQALQSQDSVTVSLHHMGKRTNATAQLDLTQLKGTAQAFPISALGIRPELPVIPNRVDRVIAESPADKAGVKVGDRILSINKEVVSDWNEMMRYIRLNPQVKQYHLRLQRGTKRFTVAITPEQKRLPTGEPIPMMGIQSSLAHYALDRVQLERYPPWYALRPALQRTNEISWATATMLVRLISGQLSLQAMTGPVGIAVTAGAAAKSGLVEFLHFLAMISVSLAIINLLPLPVLDGGHLLFYLIETIRRRPLSIKTQRLAIEFGLYVIIGLMVVVSVNDIFGKVFHL